jgi:protein MAK11
MVSWIEIKNECSDHVNYKLAWLKKKKLDVFMHPVFFLYFITSGSGKKLIQSNCLKNCAENQTGCLKKEKVSYE